VEAYGLAAVSLLSVALVCFGSRLRGETSRYGKPPRLLLLRLFFSPHFCFHFIFIFIFVGLIFSVFCWVFGEGFSGIYCLGFSCGFVFCDGFRRRIYRGVVLLGVMGFGEGFLGLFFVMGFGEGFVGFFFVLGFGD